MDNLRSRIVPGMIACALIWLGTSAWAQSQAKGDGALAAAAQAPTNLVANGGFEQWRALTRNEKQSFNRSRQPNQQEQKMLDGMQWPDGWFLWIGGVAQAAQWSVQDVGILADKTEKHAGSCSIQMDNRNHDISLSLNQRFDAAPNTRYRITMWLKGDHIDTYQPKGILVSTIASSKPGKDDNSQAGRLSLDTQFPARKEATFDWQAFTYTFDTPPQTRTIMLCLELRGAGTLWVDDVQGTELGKIIAVESF